MRRCHFIAATSILILSLVLVAPSTFAADKSNPEFVLQGVHIGQAVSEILVLLGEPSRIDLSEYGFEWYIYNQDYSSYIQVGVQEDKVVALYTNATDWFSTSGIGFGSTKKEVELAYGQPLTQIKKGNTIFNYQESGQEYGLYLLGNVFATIFYDVHQENKVTAIQLIEQATELAFTSFYGDASEELRAGFERQTFDLANAVRVRSGQEALEWNEQIAATARKHSQDMIIRNYFAHNTPNGKTPFDRIKADGITYSLASENIAAGQTNAIFAHEGWMNSLGHRQNILGDYNYLGVGISFGGSFHIYYTQNFFQPLS